MIREETTVNIPGGLHLRPAAKLSEAAVLFSCRITLENGPHAVNAKSVLGVLGACVRCGDTIVLTCDGPDEAEAMKTLLSVLEEE